DQGADIVYAVAGGSGLGVLKASADANRYSVGVDSDQNNLYPGHVLASMLKRVDNSLFDMIKAAKEGTLQYGGKVYPYGLSNQGVGLLLDTKDVPQSVQDRLKAAEQKVASGEVKVETVTGSGK
ncbi:MAG: BMP family ABC transporter substrate-binding protein, partial [Sphaerobacter sp.]|nr:BMP family ABC transporter substrate-binding protein [Sphaerobacter sp.]